MLFIILIEVISFGKLKAQPGGNNCAQALANPLSIPFDFNMSTCGRGNNYTGANGCSSASAWMNPFGGQDRFFAVTPTQSGFLSLTFSNVTAASMVVPIMHIFEGCPTAGGTCIRQVTGNTSAAGVTTIIPVSAGVTYYIVIDAVTYSFINYANCFSFRLRGNMITVPVQPSCTNMDFSTGDFTGWFGTTGTATTGPVGAPTPTYNITATGIVNGRHTIMTGGNDPCGGFPRVDPQGGPFSVRLGNNQTGAQAEQLRQTFLVSQSNSSFTYRYAVVFEDPNHSPQDQPFFRALIRDQNGNVVPCSDFVVSAGVGIPGFLNSTTCATVRFKPWSSVNVDLSNYIGQNVTVEFTAGDCSHSGHYGYAYIDAACAPSTLSTLGDTICAGQSATLTAPVGYSSYNWMPGNLNTQTITVSPSQTTIYTLSLTAFNGCVSTYQIPVVVTPQPQPAFSFDAPACDQPVAFTASGTAPPGVTLSASWNFGVGASPVTSQQSNVNVMFPGPGTYPVTLSQTSSAGCNASVTQNVTVPPCVFTARITGDTICAGACYTLQVATSFGNGPFQYVWSTGATGASINVCPAQTTIYEVTVTDSQGNVSTDTAQVTIAPVIQFNPTVQHISCHGSADGNIALSPSGFGPFSYSWSNGVTASAISSLSPGDYAVVVSDRFGCQGNAQYAITQPDPILMNLLPNDATCNEANGQVEVNVIGGGTAPYQYAIENQAFGNNAVFTNLNQGTYSLQVSDANGCVSSQSAQVGMVSFPVQLQYSVTDATCGYQNGAYSIHAVSGGIAPFSLQVNGAAIQPLIGFPYQAGQQAAGTYTITIRDANNCILDTNIIIQQFYGPTLVQLDLSPATCGLNNAELDILSVTGGTGPFAYQINQGDFNYQTHYDNLPPGFLNLVVIDSNNCVLDTVLSIPFIADLEIQAEKLSDVLCFGEQNGVAQVQMISGSAPYQVTWSNGVQSETNNTLAEGTWIVTVTDALGCMKYDSVLVMQPPVLTAGVDILHATCNLPNGALEVINATGGSGTYTYSLNQQAAVSSATFNQLSQGSYQITLQDENQCSIAIDVAVQMISFPTSMDWSHVDATCDLDNGSITISSVNGGIEAFSIAMQGGDWQAVQSFPYVFTGLNAGDYLILINDLNHCTIDTLITLLQFSGPQLLNADITPATCDLDNASIQLQASGGVSPLSYSFHGASFGPQTLFNQLQAGVYNAVVRDSNNCELTQVFEIEALENVSAQINLVLPVVCHNDSTGALMAQINSGYAPFTLAWSNGASTAMNTALPAGTYQLTVTDSNNCVVSMAYQLSNPEPLQLQIHGPDYVCEGMSAAFSANVTGAQGHSLVNWMNGHMFGEQITIMPDSTMLVSATATDALGCQGTDVHHVLRRLNPQGTAVPDLREGCAPVCADFELNISSPDSIVSVQWTSSLGQPGGGYMQKFCFNESGLQGASVTITDFYGCKNTIDATQTVQVYPVPVAEFTYDPNKADILNPVYRFYQQSTDAATSYWTFGDGNSSFEYEPVHHYQDTGRYEVCLRVTSGFNCLDQTCKKVDVIPFPTFYAPNIFTPNGDGVNDEFKLYFTYVKDFQMEIYNRWGELLFTSADHERGWDGNYKFAPVQDDTYVWKARFRNSLDQVKTEIGRVTLVR